MKRFITIISLLLMFAVLLSACGTDTPATPQEPHNTEGAPNGDKAKAPRPAWEQVKHEFPEPLLVFKQKANGSEPYDLSPTTKLQVDVNHCEYGEPSQYITDSAIISNVTAALSGITVTGNHDNMDSTETYYVYSLYDAEDKYICGFSFQNGMLMEKEGRYPLSGLSALLSVEGIKLKED